MMYKLAGYEPQRVFEIFEEISNVPRCTYHIEGITAHCIEFAEKLGLPVRKDEAGNVIITKPGTEGYESSEPVILQGHLDMVAEKLPESTHDFLSEGIELYVEDGLVRAKGTTLGGDNGIAVAMAMAVLESKTRTIIYVATKCYKFIDIYKLYAYNKSKNRDVLLHQ